MQKLNKNGLLVKRVISNELNIGNTVVNEETTTPTILTQEQIELLSHVASAEGRIIDINDDGSFETSVGHSYSVTATPPFTIKNNYGQILAVSETSFQRSFVANTKITIIEGGEECNVVEVFRGAALMNIVNWGGENNLPDGYLSLDYLESNGFQYIMTGTINNQNSAIRARFQITDKFSGDQKLFGGARVGLSTLGGNFRASTGNATNISVTSDVFEFIATASTSSTNSCTGQLKNLSNGLIRSSDYFWTADGSSSATGLFTSGYEGGTIMTSTLPYLRLMSYSQINDNVEVLNCVPCLDFNGAPCMYDCVNGISYYNQGTGDFLYPSVAPSMYSLRNEIPEWGKLTPYGLKRLYHLPENYTGELDDYIMENNFKQIIETEKPESGYWIPQWNETENEIVLEWVETEPPTDLES